MGVVHAADQSSLRRTVAIKRVREEVASPEAHLRLLQEGTVTGLLEHPNIVPVHDLGVDEHGAPYLVLKRVQGDRWLDLIYDPELLDERHAPPDRLEWHLHVLLEVCNGVAFAHDRGVLHRDLKPENIMVGAFGEVLVMDWGLAVALPHGDPRLPRASDEDGLVGTPAYMAPEMLPHAAAPPLSPATDVYLLGACLFEVLVGHPPRVTRDRAALLRHVLHSPPPIPDTVPSELARICRTAMAREPSERFADVEAFAAALRDTLRHRSSAALAAEAERRASVLLQQLTSPDGDVLTIHAAFGAVTFGFRQALDGWPGNEDAREGLQQVVSAMARWELSRGEPAAALSALGLVDTPEPALEREVRDAVATAEAQARALEAWRRDHDPRIGRRGRLVAILVIGLFVSLVPLTYSWGEQVTAGGPHPAHAWLASFAFIIVATPLVGALRATAPMTAITRPLSWTIMLVGLGQLLLTAGCTLLELPPRTTAALFMVVWWALSSAAAALVDRRLWFGTAGYVAAWLLAPMLPDWMYELMAGANLIMTVSCVWALGVASGRRETKA